MGVPAFNLATSVSLIIAQSLARRLCNECSVPADDVPDETWINEGFTEEMLVGARMMKAVGCDNCTGGYRGRVGVYEVVPVTAEISRLIMEQGNSIQIGQQARNEGFNDLRTSALVKAAQGLTSLEEVNRITTD